MPDVTEYDKMPGCFLSQIRNIDEKLRNIVPKIRQNDRKIRSKKNELCGFRTTQQTFFHKHASLFYIGEQTKVL